MTGGVGIREGKERGQPLVDLLCAKSFTSSMSRSLPKSLLENHYCLISSSQMRKLKFREVGHLVKVTQRGGSGAGIPASPVMGQLSKEQPVGFRLFFPYSLSRARESFRLPGVPLLPCLPWLPSALQIKTKLSEALKALCSGLRPPPEPTSYHVLISETQRPSARSSSGPSALGLRTYCSLCQACCSSLLTSIYIGASA